MAWSASTSRNHNGIGRGRSEELMDQENQRMTENLAGKVSRLKNIAFEIENDAKDSNTYLSGMQEDFEGSASLLGGTMKRVNYMLTNGKGNRKLMCYIVLGLVIVFVICYYFVLHFRGG